MNAEISRTFATLQAVLLRREIQERFVPAFDAEVYAQDPAETWISGGCFILAPALVRLLGPRAELWAVCNSDDEQGHIEHSFVRYGDWCIDGTGILSPLAMRQLWGEVFTDRPDSTCARLRLVSAGPDELWNTFGDHAIQSEALFVFLRSLTGNPVAVLRRALEQG